MRSPKIKLFRVLLHRDPSRARYEATSRPQMESPRISGADSTLCSRNFCDRSFFPRWTMSLGRRPRRTRPCRRTRRGSVAGDLATDGRRRAAQPLVPWPLLRGQADTAALIQTGGRGASVPRAPARSSWTTTPHPAFPDFILLSRRKPVATHLCLHHVTIRGRALIT